MKLLIMTVQNIETQNKAFTKKTTDYSNEKYFSFGFVCDCCGMEWVSPKKPYTDGDRKAEHKIAFNEALEKAMRFFNKCPVCGNWVCDDCFDVEEIEHGGVCKNCNKE